MLYRQVPRVVEKPQAKSSVTASILSMGSSFTSSPSSSSTATTSPSHHRPVKEDPLFAHLGNAAHALVLVNAIVFALAFSSLGELSLGSNQWFDEQWKQDGFCVNNSHGSFGNTHDVCFYFNVLACLVLAVVHWAIHRTPGMEKANEYFAPCIIQTLARGVAHGFLGKAIRDGTLVVARETQQQEQHNFTRGYQLLGNLSWDDIVTLQLPSLLFWFGLIKARCRNMSTVKVGALSILAFLAQLVVPVQLGFVFVQTVVVVAFSLSQLVRPADEKDFMYATFPINVVLPITLVAWVEATQCTNFVRDHLFGHLSFDVVLQYALVSWYILCYLFSIGAKSMAKRVKKVKFA